MKAYTISRTDEQYSEYGLLKIELLDLEIPSSYRGHVALTWQGNKQGHRTAEDNAQWYAFGITVEADSPAAFAAGAKLVQAALHGADDLTPGDLLTTLTRRGFKRAVYDVWEHGHILIENVKPGTRYMDDWDAAGYAQRHCTVAAIAETPEDAKIALAADFARYLTNGWSKSETAERFSQWAAAGCPVREDTFARPPDTRTVEELLEL